MKGTVIAICRGSEKGRPKIDVHTGFFEKSLGLVGDAHAGTEREVSILAREKVNQLSQETGLCFPPGAFAENLLIEGVDQAEWIPGRRVRVGRALLQIDHIGKAPGSSHSYHYQGYSLLPHYGIFARVVEAGLVKNGDTAEILNSFP